MKISEKQIATLISIATSSVIFYNKHGHRELAEKIAGLVDEITNQQLDKLIEIGELEEVKE